MVANLWDVTDGDADRLSNSLLQQWVLDAGAAPALEAALSAARAECRMQLLVGAAAVVYGLPAESGAE